MKSFLSATFSTRRVALLALASSALFAAGAAQAQAALDNILKSKTLKVAVPTDYPPYGSVDRTMTPIGLKEPRIGH